MVRVLFSSLLRESFFVGLGFLRNRPLLESPGNSVDLRYERVFYTDLVFLKSPIAKPYTQAGAPDASDLNSRCGKGEKRIGFLGFAEAL